MKKIVAIAAAGALAFTLAGCSSNTVESRPSEEPASNLVQKEEAPKDLNVVESGWSEQADGMISYAAIVENPNAAWMANYANVTVTGKDANGAILFSNKDTLPYVFPGGKQAICSGANVDAASLSDIEVTASVADKNWTQETVQAADADTVLQVTNLNEIAGEYGDYSFTGELLSNMDDPMNAVHISIVIRDESGAIVRGCDTYVNDVAPGSTTPFQAYAFGDMPEHASYEAYAVYAY